MSQADRRTSRATVSPNGRTLYVTNTADRTIPAYRIGPDGKPGKLRDFRATSDFPKQTVLSPDGRFLYLSYADVDETGDSPPRVITRFAVRFDGTLGPAQDVAKVGQADFGIAIAPDGRDVFAAVRDTNQVAAFEIGSGGTLKEATGSPFLTGGERPLSQSIVVRPAPAPSR